MMTTISKKNHRKPPIGGFFVRCYFVIEKIYGVGIIADAIGVSSNGRTRDFGSLYHGSNPCAPTKIKQCPQGAFFILLYVTDCTISCTIVRQNIINVLYVFQKITDFPKH